MSDTVIAAQLYTIREFLKTPPDIARSLKKVAQAGYRAVQVSGMGPMDPNELRKIADGEGLRICATHVTFEELRDTTDASIEKHNILGCPHVAIGGMPQDYRKDGAEGISRFARDAHEVGRKLVAAGKTFSYHNHDWEFALYGDRLALDIIYQESAPRFVMAELDVHWVARGGGSPVAWIRKLAGRQVLLHLKDFAVVDRAPVFAEVGEGNLDWPGILCAAKSAGVQWYIVEQDTCRRDPFESLKISLLNLQKWGLR